MMQPSTFICAVQGSARASCVWEPFYRELQGGRYCVLHYPGLDKREAFAVAFLKKYARRDFNFSGVWFPSDQHFTNSIFESDADFSYATFSGEADFRAATFKSRAVFRETRFRAKADFGGTTFE